MLVFLKKHRGRIYGKGFTLIELLVVIAIIAILATILLPSLTKAKEMAKSIKCISNLKNLALAINLYASDYDNRLPRGLNRPDANPQTNNWTTPDFGIFNYTDSSYEHHSADVSERFGGIFRCPTVDPAQVGFPAMPISYCFNAELNISPSTKSRSNINEDTHRQISTIAYPGTTFLLCDTTEQYAAVATGANLIAYRALYYFVGRNVHGLNTINMAFADGHVKTVDNIWESVGLPFYKIDIRWDDDVEHY